jgi:hypothetical protein
METSEPEMKDTNDDHLAQVRAKVEGLRDAHIETERDALFRTHLDRLLKCDERGNLLPEPVTFTATGETRGILILDGAGGGKTSLVRQGLKTHPAFEAAEATAMPFVGVRVPNPATIKSLGLEILRATGYAHVSERRERWSIWNLVRERLRLLGTVVLWIDEAHDLVVNGKRTDIEHMLKMLKSLMQGDGAVIVILTGIEDLGAIASYDDQVKRRYSKIVLPSVTLANDGPLFRELVAAFSEQAGLAPPDADDLVARLMHGSRYRFGRCIETTINAIEVALLEGATQLDISHFAEAWAMQEGCKIGQNVFLSPRWSQIDLSAPART